MTQKCVLGLLCVWIACSVFAAASVDAKKILDEAQQGMKTRTYRVDDTILDNNKKTRKINLQYVDPSGIVYKRSESIWEQNHLILIDNASGAFRIYKDTKSVVKMDYALRRITYSNQSERYSCEEKVIDGKSYYEITRNMTPDEESFQKYARVYFNKPTDTSEKARAAFARAFVVKAIYRIGKDDNFIYQEHRYNASGKMTVRIEYKNVDLSPKINMKDFEISRDYTMFRAESQEMERKLWAEQFSKKREMTYGKKGNAKPSLIQQGLQFIDRKSDQIASWGSGILAVFAGLLVVLIVILKWKNNRT